MWVKLKIDIDASLKKKKNCIKEFLLTIVKGNKNNRTLLRCISTT